MDIDLSDMPFSRRGNWMNIAELTEKSITRVQGGLYLQNNHARGVAANELFRLQLLDASGKQIQQNTRCDGICLTLTSDTADGRVEIIFDGNDSLRIRGRKLGLELSIPFRCFVVAHPAGQDLWTVNHRSRLRRYQFQRLTGTVQFSHQWKVHESLDVRLACSGEKWEVAIDEFWSTWKPKLRRDFQDLRTETAAEFEAFAEAIEPDAGQWAAPARLAAWLLWSATQSPTGLLGRESVFMSLNHMDQVWSWDNCFNAAALAGGLPELAIDQFLTVADHQDACGAYPDGLNDGFKHYNFSKPPVQGLLLDWIRSRHTDFWTIGRIEQLYPTTARFTQWWLDHRFDQQRGLCYYLHGNDSGWDNATMFDQSVPLISPDLNGFLIAQQHTLADMAGVLGMDDERQRWTDSAEAMQDRLIEQLWTGQGFTAIRTADGRRVECDSLIPNMPIVLGKRLDEKIRNRLVANIEKFVTDHGLATELPTSEHYDGDGYWRGPVWAPSTMLAVMGLRSAGAGELADRIARNFCTTCREGGFAENFDAVTGAPRRDRAYTWTASALLCLSSELDD
ncbi:MAG: amylo-alpha-1,6-glucosidase [Phycisphaerae bacterium]